MNQLFKSDHGDADILSVMAACTLALLFASVAVANSLGLMPNFERNDYIETFKQAGAIQEKQYLQGGKYLDQSAFTAAPENSNTQISDGGRCYTMVGKIGTELIMMESGTTEPVTVKTDTRSTCVGRAGLQSAANALQANMLMTGPSVIPAPSNLRTSAGTLSWDAPAGWSGGYIVKMTKNTLAPVQTKTTGTSYGYASSAGDTLKFEVTADSATDTVRPAEFIERFSPISPVANWSFETTGSWTKTSLGGAFTTVDRTTCAGSTTTGKAASLTSKTSITSSRVFGTSAGGEGRRVQVSIESCGPILPVVQTKTYSSNGPLQLSTQTVPTKWGVRTSVEFIMPTFVEIIITNPSASTLYVDNVNITSQP